MILAAKEGYNSNQLLGYLDFDMIKSHPKIFCGFSDITVLNNAIFAKTGLVTYSGPTFVDLGLEENHDKNNDHETVNKYSYTRNYFLKILTGHEPIQLPPSDYWNNKDCKKSECLSNVGFVAIQPGSGIGTALGGNLCSFNLLQGTQYMPSLKDTILFIEDDPLLDEDAFPKEFDRNLQSLIHLPDFKDVKGIVFGRFKKECGMNFEKLRVIVDSKRELNNLPILANADFGHTTPLFTFPIGGKVRIEVGESVSISILKY